MSARDGGVAATIAALVLIAIAAPADAQPGASDATVDHGVAIDAALVAYGERRWEEVDRLLAPITADAGADPRDRAEAHRMRGMAAYHAGDREGAEAHFFAYLQFDPDAELEPQDPPEAKEFLRRVRKDHQRELDALRPRRPAPWAMSFLPPVAQFANGEPRKGWAIAIAGGALVVSTVGSYALLRSWCDEGDGTCGTRTADARTLRVVNLASGGALAALYLYGVIDGFANRPSGERRPPNVAPIAFSTGDGAGVGVAGRF